MLVVMMSVSAACQNDVFQKVADNPDGSKRITINGVTYLAITGPQVDAWQKSVNDLKDCQAHNQEKALQIAKLETEKAAEVEIVQRADAQRESALADATRARTDARTYLGLSMKLDTLLTESRQLTPHGNVGGFGGKLLKFMDSSYFQAFVKVAAPTGTFLRAYTARCPQ